MAELLSQGGHDNINQESLDNAVVEKYDPVASGQINSYFDHSNIIYAEVDLKFLQDGIYSRDQDAGLCLLYTTSGQWNERIDGQDLDFSLLHCPTILGLGRPVEMTTSERKGDHVKLSALYINKDFFETNCRDQEDEGLLALSDWMQSGICLERLMDCPRLGQILQQLANNPYHGKMASIYREHHLLDVLLCMADYARCEQNGLITRSKSAHDLALEVEKELKQALHMVPKVSDLAKKLGTNETKLRKSFKSVFGKSIIAYAQDLRLDASRLMLRENRFSVSEVAYRVGYSNASNFSNAYKHRFGYAPKFERDA